MFGGFGYTKDTRFIHNFQYFLKVLNKNISPYEGYACSSITIHLRLA